MASTRLLKIVRLRPAVCPFSGEPASRLARPPARISPVSIRALDLLSDMSVQHHPKEIEPRVEQGVGDTTGHAFRGARGMHNEQDAVEDSPEVRGGEHLASHRRVEE